MSAAAFPEKDPALMFDVAQDMLGKQLDFADSLDNKLGSLVSLGSALLALIAALFALKGKISGGELALLVIAGIAYARLSWVGLSAYAARLWAVGPNLAEVWGAHAEPTTSDSSIRWRVAAEYVKNFRSNESAYAKKYDAAKHALGCVVAETLALAIALSLLATS